MTITPQEERRRDIQRSKIELTARETLVRDFLLEMIHSPGQKADKISAANDYADAVLGIEEKKPLRRFVP